MGFAPLRSFPNSTSIINTLMEKSLALLRYITRDFYCTADTIVGCCLPGSAEKLLAAALSGKGAERQKDEVPADDLPELDADLIRALAQHLSKEGADSARLRSIVAQVMASDA